MSEAELTASAALYFDLTMTALSLYISVCSGYLVAGYAIGSKLSTFQALVVSSLFTFIAIVSTYCVWGWGGRAFRYNEIAKQLTDTNLVQSGNSSVAIVLSGMMLIGTLACLKFMWDIRNTKLAGEV